MTPRRSINRSTRNSGNTANAPSTLSSTAFADTTNSASRSRDPAATRLARCKSTQGTDKSRTRSFDNRCRARYPAGVTRPSPVTATSVSPLQAGNRRNVRVLRPHRAQTEA